MRKTLAFLAILTGVFAALKLANWISWSWWWVAAPVWGPFAFAAGFVMFVLLMTSVRGGGAK